MHATSSADRSHLASMPDYRAHTLDPHAGHHIVAWAGTPGPEDLAFAAQLAEQAAGRHTLLRADGEAGAAQDALAAALVDALRGASAGTHLYLSGTESQVWRLYNEARQLGMQPQEISVFRSAASPRPVYCVHCSTLQQTDGSPETTCSHCGVRLMVRDHFSRRLGAYMGVVADADNPYAKGQA